MTISTLCSTDWEGARTPVPQLFTANIYGYYYPNSDASGWLPELEVK